MLAGEHRFRVVRNRIFARPAAESFHEFLVFWLKCTFGDSWHRKHRLAQPADRHVVMRWILAWHELALRTLPLDHRAGEVRAAVPTGEVLALLVLADDLYRLHLADALPPDLVVRLRDAGKYQGARYEVAVAAVFVRAGCSVNWTTAANHLTCEFTAKFDSGEVVAVEAKSRHREGVLHQRGAAPADWSADVDNLYRKAQRKDPDGHPLVVFLDVNRPHEPGAMQVGQKQWHKDIGAMFRSRLRRKPENTPESPMAVSLVVVTNWSWHLEGSAHATEGEFLAIEPEWPARRVPARVVQGELLNALTFYGVLPANE